MANIGAWAQTNMLNWVLRGGGSSPTQPAVTYVGLSLTAPTSVSFFEVGGASGYTRASPGFSSASTVAGTGGSIANSAAATFGPFSSSAVISGLFICDHSTSAAPNMLWYGNLATVRTPLQGDSLVLAINALSITLQ